MFSFQGVLYRSLGSKQDILEIPRSYSISDEQGFVVFMKQNQDCIYRLAFHLLGNAEDAKDAVQETFMKAWKKLDTLRWESAQTWLLKITVNLCLDWLRRRKFRKDYSEINDDPDDDFEQRLPDPCLNPLEECISREAQLIVQKAISELPPHYRAVVLLKDMEDLNYHEISEILHIPVSKVKSDLFRGRRKLKELLRPVFEGNV